MVMLMENHSKMSLFGKVVLGKWNHLWESSDQNNRKQNFKKAIYYRIGDWLSLEMVKEDLATCIKIGKISYLPLLLLIRCRTEVRMKELKEVYNHEKLLSKMDDVMTNSDDNNYLKLQNAIEQVNLVVGQLIEPFII